jgi:hypothetical protein
MSLFALVACPPSPSSAGNLPAAVRSPRPGSFALMEKHRGAPSSSSYRARRWHGLACRPSPSQPDRANNDGEGKATAGAAGVEGDDEDIDVRTGSACAASEATGKRSDTARAWRQREGRRTRSGGREVTELVLDTGSGLAPQKRPTSTFSGSRANTPWVAY